MHKPFLILTVIILFFSASAMAEIYKWTDANGVVHFEDKPPQNIAPLPH